jgi:hypothetical protein
MATPAHWILHGGSITVHYDSSGPGVFHYVALPGPTKTFNGPQIQVLQAPPLGRLVSVVLNANPVAEIVFTVLLPDVQVDAAHPVEPVQTDGITTHRLLFPPLGQREHYEVTRLIGSAKL